MLITLGDSCWVIDKTITFSIALMTTNAGKILKDVVSDAPYSYGN